MVPEKWRATSPISEDAGRSPTRCDHARARQKYAEDPRRSLLYYKEWKARNPEKAAAYQRAADHRRRSAGPSFTANEWRELLERYRHECAYCGATGNLEADHRIPICRGGSNSIENILPACRRCNRTKFTMTEQEFRARRLELTGRALRVA